MWIVWLVFTVLIIVAALMFWLAVIGQGADWGIEKFCLPTPKLRRWKRKGIDVTLEPSDLLSDRYRRYCERYDDLWCSQFCYSWSQQFRR